MTRFFTNVANGTGLARDDEGQDFVSFQEARQSAVRAARDIVAEEIKAGHDRVNLELYIQDEAGTCLAMLPVAATIIGAD